MTDVMKQCRALLDEGYPRDAVERFVRLSVRTGKISVSEAAKILSEI